MKKSSGYNYSIKQEKSFKRELKNIYRYIANDLKENKIAIKFVDAVISKLKDLQMFPFAYELYKKEKNFEYRKLIINSLKKITK